MCIEKFGYSYIESVPNHLPRQIHRVGPLRLHGVHPDRLPPVAEAPDGGGHPGDEAAPAAADEDDVGVGHVLGDLDAQAGVAGDEVAVVVRVEEDGAVGLMLE